MMESGILEYKYRKFNINSYYKQVWIITKGRSRIIKRINDIIVKEVSINDLFSIYLNRLNYNIDEDDLGKKY
ncbi:MAG: hypothetical protein F7C08_00135, partial [Desulfurococcales archaeon]|nr:hypothetical protein [Desulfurococcales archaeon]